MGFCYSLKHEVDDLEVAWNFLKNKTESDYEEDKGKGSATKELSADQIGKANTAIHWMAHPGSHAEEVNKQ